MGSPPNPTPGAGAPGAAPGTPAPDRGLTFDAEHGLTGNRYIQFATRNLNPPSQLYVTADDGLYVSGASVTAGATVTICAQLLLPDGRLAVNSYTVTPPSSGAITPYLFPLTEGYLFNVTAQPAPGVRRGQVWLYVALRRGSLQGGINLQTLLQDYVDAYSGPTWPGGAVRMSTEGSGLQTSVYTDPINPGLNYTFTVPAYARIIPRSVWCQFSTSAVVANRHPTIQFNDSAANVLFRDSSDFIQPASTTVTYSWSYALGTSQTSSIAGTISRALPQIVLEPNYQIYLWCISMDAGDQFRFVNISFEQWFST